MTQILLRTIKYERRWTLKCLAILAYHNSCCNGHGNTRNNKWTIEDTASELNFSNGYISESIKLAKALTKIPQLETMTREKALEFLRSKE